MSGLSSTHPKYGRVQAKRSVTVSGVSGELPVVTESSGQRSTVQLSTSTSDLVLTPIPVERAVTPTQDQADVPNTPRNDSDDETYTRVYIGPIPQLESHQTLSWVLEPNEAAPQQTIFMCKCGSDAQTIEMTLPLQVNYGFRKYQSKYTTGKPDVSNNIVYLSGSYMGDESYPWFHGNVYQLPKVDELRAKVLQQLQAMYVQHQHYLAVPSGSPDDTDTTLQGPRVNAGVLGSVGIELSSIIPAMNTFIPSDGKTKYTYRIMLPLMHGTPHTLLHGQSPVLKLYTNKLGTDVQSTPVKGLRVVEGLEDYLHRYNVIIKGRFTIGVEVCNKLESAQGTRQPYKAGLLPISAVLILLPKSNDDLARWRESEGAQQVSETLRTLLKSEDDCAGQI